MSIFEFSSPDTPCTHRVQVPFEDGLGGELLPENGLEGAKTILRMVLDP